MKENIKRPMPDKKDLDGYIDSFQHEVEQHEKEKGNLVVINEEIVQREEEKSILLSLSNEIAALRNREDLSRLINTRIKKLFSENDIAFAQINEDRTYGAFRIDYGENLTADPDYEKLTTAKYDVNDPVFSSIMKSDDPVILEVDSLAEKTGMPPYVNWWKKMGLVYVLGKSMRAGGKDIGAAYMHTLAKKQGEIKVNLMNAVCAQLAVAISNILANEKLLAYKKELEAENDYLKEQIKTIYDSSEIVGSGPQMQQVYGLMSLVAESDSTVLLLGETGTGKELIARAIHNSSLRGSKLMVKVNCAALPANLIESELFGHEKGSFTGAIERRIGKFELADTSTLFLDEIAEIPLETQAKLLRVLQERELERVGGKTTIKVDVRIVAATNRNLENEVKAGRFRADLYYRLNVFPITLPPLRDRTEDILPLAYFFLERYSKISGKKVTSVSAKCLEDLKSYTWPGNVRELEHLIERSILLTQGNVLTEIQLPRDLNQQRNDGFMTDDNTIQDIQLVQGANVFPSLQTGQQFRSLEENERAHILSVLKATNGKIRGKDGAAEILGIPPTTLHSKIKKLGIRKTLN